MAAPAASSAAALMHMSAAGATMGTWFALSCELLCDWRRPTAGDAPSRGTAQAGSFLSTPRMFSAARQNWSAIRASA
jgi:hypothetical protein